MKNLTSIDVKLTGNNIFKNYLQMLDNSLVVSCDFTKKDICKLAEKIINIDPNDINLEQQLEYLFVELIRNKKIPLSKNINWELVCEKCAIIYTRNLNKKKQRSLRTKAIRNNFLIREMIDKYKETNRNKTHSEEIGLFVWDFKTYLDKKILITSDKKNLKIFSQNFKKEFNIGLPTQIDILSDGNITIGSAYSKGFFHYKKNGSLVFENSSVPIITTFKYDKDFFVLKKNGLLIKNEKSFFNLKKFSNSIWKARFIKPNLIVMDWSKPKCLLMLNLENLEMEIVELPEVYIPNDICKYKNNYYVVDKMQGSIFSFDESFKFRSKCLQFGKNPGMLYDPISICAENRKLCVISWLNKYMVRLLPF